MSTDNPNATNDSGTVEVISDSLDDFATELFGESKAALDNAKSEETGGEDEDTSNAPEEEQDTQSDDLDEEEVSEDDDTLAPDENDDDDSDEGNESEDPQPKKKKNRFQERIDELTAARKEAERQREADRLEYQQRLAALEEQLKGSKKEEEPETPAPTNVQEVDPDVKNADGTKKYPLGRYDPQYLKDTVQAMFDAKQAEAEQRQKQTAEERQREQAQMELQTEWNTKLETARERYPDFQTKGQQMLGVFEGIDEQYGEYLTTTLMEMDNGPDVFYYLSNNIEEAQEIVKAGPRKATIAFAKLEAQLGDGGRKGKAVASNKVSRAKEPPPQNKGSAVAKPKVPVDTDDLSAFERELFRSK